MLGRSNLHQAAMPGQKRTLVRDLAQQAIERIVKELKRCPHKALACERLVMGNHLVDNTDSEVDKPYPDAYNLMKFIPKADKQDIVVSYKPDFFSHHHCCGAV